MDEAVAAQLEGPTYDSWRRFYGLKTMASEFVDEISVEGRRPQKTILKDSGKVH